MGQPAKWSKRHIVDAIRYVAATGCQWRALPSALEHRPPLPPHLAPIWHLGTDRRSSPPSSPPTERPRPRSHSVRHRRPISPGSINRRSFYQGYDASKKVSGRKVFGLVDTMGATHRHRGRPSQLLRQRRRNDHYRPGHLQNKPTHQGLARRRIQENLRQALPQSRHRFRDSGTDQPELLRGRTPPLGSRTYLGPANQPPASTHRPRT